MMSQTLYVSISGETVTVGVLGKFLENLQVAIFNIAEGLEGVEGKRVGSFGSRIKENYSLLIKEVSKGSIVLGLETPPEDTRVIPEIGGILKTTNEGNFREVESRFESPVRARRVISSIYDVYRSAKKNTIEFDFPSHRKIMLSYDRTKDMRKYLTKKIEPTEEVLFGRLTQITVDRHRTSSIATPSGIRIIKYPKENEEIYKTKLKDHLDKFIKISGILRFKGSQGILDINEESLRRIKVDNTVSVKEYITDGVLFELKKPIEFKVKVDDDRYVLINSKLNLYAFDKDLHKAFREMKEIIGALFKEYVEVDESKLTVDARELRKTLVEARDG